jgi:hypothetical protein
MTQRVWIAVIFLIGCTAGGVASQLAVPTIRAGTQPQRWEYLCAQSSPEASKLSTALNNAGSSGWELVSTVAAHLENEGVGPVSAGLQADSYVFCFKRALP